MDIMELKDRIGSYNSMMDMDYILEFTDTSRTRNILKSFINPLIFSVFLPFVKKRPRRERKT